MRIPPSTGAVMSSITLSIAEISSIRNRQIQSLIAVKLSSMLAESLATMKADPKAQSVPSVAAYLSLLDQVEAAKPVKRRAKRKEKPAAP